MIVIDLKFLSR